jgi:hypothetical protein
VTSARIARHPSALRIASQTTAAAGSPPPPGRPPTEAAGSVLGPHRVQLDPVDEVGSSIGLACAACSPRVSRSDSPPRRASASVIAANRDQLDAVHLDQTEADPVAAAPLDLRPLPQPDRQHDIAGQDVIAQLVAELHPRTLPATATDAVRRSSQAWLPPHEVHRRACPRLVRWTRSCHTARPRPNSAGRDRLHAVGRPAV